MKTRIFLTVVIVTTIFLGFIGFARADGTVISISPSPLTIPQSQIGTNFKVNINISAVTNLWSWAANLNWNASVLNFTKISEGPFLKSAGNTFFAPTFPKSGSLPDISDSIDFSNDSVSGSGILATVTFKVLGAGQSGITLSDTALWLPLSKNYTGHPLIPHTVDNGQVIVLPEFSSWALLTIAIAATVPTVILAKKRLKPKR